MTDPKQVLSAADVLAAVPSGWREDAGAITARFATGSFVAGRDLIVRITDAAEAANHHPDVDLRYPHVDVLLTSHDVDGLTQRDVDLAIEITDLASGSGVEIADPES